MSDKSKRIRKLLAIRPHMTVEQIARKIGMPTPEGLDRVHREMDQIRLHWLKQNSSS